MVYSLSMNYLNKSVHNENYMRSQDSVWVTDQMKERHWTGEKATLLSRPSRGTAIKSQ